MKRTFTEVGKQAGYTVEEINSAILKIKWVDFRKDNLPFCQGECLKAVVNQCNIPLSKISRMDIHNIIKYSHGFYALDVKYKNGQAQIYIADDGVNPCVVASDFTEVQKYYCEYCGEENLKSHVEDEIGGIFCNKRCHKLMQKDVDYKSKLIQKKGN